jgi:hypothetical protein
MLPVINLPSTVSTRLWGIRRQNLRTRKGFPLVLWRQADKPDKPGGPFSPHYPRYSVEARLSWCFLGIRILGFEGTLITQTWPLPYAIKFQGSSFRVGQILGDSQLYFPGHLIYTEHSSLLFWVLLTPPPEEPHYFQMNRIRCHWT